MRIAVCVKTVVDPQARIELGADGRIRREQLSWEINEYDLYAIEEALRLADASAGSVTLVSLGDDSAVAALRKGLAMGATDAVHVRCDAEGLDAAGVATLLAAALRARAFDLVLAGVESDDLGSSQVGVLVAEDLGWPASTLVVRTEPAVDGQMTVRQELEGGNYHIVRIALPAVLTIQSGLNEPRYPSLKGIMAAKKKEIATIEPSALGFAELPARRVETLGLATPPPRARARILEGGPEQAATELVRILRQEEKVL